MRLAVMEVDAYAPAEGQDPQQLPEAAVRARWGQGQRLPEAAVRAHWGQGQGPLGTVLSGYACGSKAARDALSC